MSRFIFTTHTKRRMSERGIWAADVKRVLENPVETKRNRNDTLKVTGILKDGRTLVVVYEEARGKVIVITAYKK